jgi:hypothetical protein
MRYHAAKTQSRPTALRAIAEQYQQRHAPRRGNWATHGGAASLVVPRLRIEDDPGTLMSPKTGMHQEGSGGVFVVLGPA